MNRLIGQQLPDLTLRSSVQTVVNPSQHKGRALYFCYPYTGKPGVANPPDWDTTPGAHGSTPQALAFAKLHPQFHLKNVAVFGLSLLSEEWIVDFSNRNALPYLLLSDHGGLFSRALDLPRFKAGECEFLQRLTLIVNDGIIMNVLYPVPFPEQNAADCLAIAS
jgi:peroxiredoxin